MNLTPQGGRVDPRLLCSEVRGLFYESKYTADKLPKIFVKKNTKKTNKKDTNDCWFIFLIKEQNVKKKKKIGLAKKQPLL